MGPGPSVLAWSVQQRLDRKLSFPIRDTAHLLKRKPERDDAFHRADAA
jgi:hypothetical protein